MGTRECHIKDAYQRRIVETLKEPLNQTNKGHAIFKWSHVGKLCHILFFLFCFAPLGVNEAEFILRAVSSEGHTHNRCGARGSTQPELFHFTALSSSLCVTSSLTLIQQDFACLWRRESRAGPQEEEGVGPFAGEGGVSFFAEKKLINQIEIIDFFHVTQVCLCCVFCGFLFFYNPFM